MSIFKNGCQALAEAGMVASNICPSGSNAVIGSVQNLFESSDVEMIDSFITTPEQIPVIKSNGFYCADFSLVDAAAADAGMDIGDICNQIMDVNNGVSDELHCDPSVFAGHKESDDEGDFNQYVKSSMREDAEITAENFCVVFEMDDLGDLITEAKSGGNLAEKAKAKLDNFVKNVKKLKKAGIQVKGKKPKK